MRKILIVDGDMISNEIYRKVFCSDDVTVIEGDDLGLLESTKFDIVIYDPESVRTDLFRNREYLRILEKNRTVVVECSSYNRDRQRWVTEEGVTHMFFMKPFVPRQFMQKVTKKYNESRQVKNITSDVIVVDDNAHHRERLKSLLSDKFRVQCFGDANDALEYIKKEKKSAVVVLDIMMDEMNGFDFLRRLRSEVNLPIPVLCLSSKKIHQFIEQAMNLGANDYMFKPYNSTKLKVAIANLAVGS